MKKIIIAAVLALSSAALFAYNPPLGGEELFRLTNPEMLSGSASSAAGGPFYNVIPSSITYNPALPAGNEIITIDVAGTILANMDKQFDEEDSMGAGFEAGVLYPTKYGTFTFVTNGIFSDKMLGLPVGKIWDFHLGAAKDFTDWLSVGVNVYYRAYMGDDSDFAVGADVGALAKIGDVAFLKNVRLGASVLNMGKAADYREWGGIDEEKKMSKYPTLFMPRASAAATVFEAGNWKGAMSADVALPLFVANCITDLAFEFEYAEKLKLTLAWQYNLRESVEQGADGINTIALGVSYKFGINAGKAGASNITPAFAMQDLYTGILAVSGGARLDLGQKDTSGAEIEMW
ncbi:MAG: hypothetical protein KBS64_06025 [Treponema sp.]|nr:hypothetical protein [Candidatus Treponema equi]